MKRRKPLRGGAPLARRTPLDPGQPLVRHTRLRQVSARRSRENRERRQMADQLWPEGRPACVVPWCRRLADDLHEPYTRARGGSITDPDNAEPVCRSHNEELTREPAWGYELDLLIHSWDSRSLEQQALDRAFLLAAWRPS